MNVSAKLCMAVKRGALICSVKKLRESASILPAPFIYTSLFFLLSLL